MKNKRYIHSKQNPNISIEEGYVICKFCNGWGALYSIDLEKNNYVCTCEYCEGVGKIDWIKNITKRNGR